MEGLVYGSRRCTMRVGSKELRATALVHLVDGAVRPTHADKSLGKLDVFMSPKGSSKYSCTEARFQQQHFLFHDDFEWTKFESSRDKVLQYVI